MTGVTGSHRYRRRGGVRIEYVIAAVVCVALLLAMIVVLVSVSNRKARQELVRRPTAQQTSPDASPAPAPTPAPQPRQNRQAPAPAPSPAPVPAPVPVAVPQQGGQPQPPSAVEVIVEDVSGAAPGAQAAPDSPVVVVESPQQPVVTATRGAYPTGKPWAVAADAPTRIQAEDFDIGGEGVGYHDASAGNEGGQYRTGEGVDIMARDDAESRHCVTHIFPGEWMNYTVNIEQSGTYVIRVRATRGSPGAGKVKVLFGGIDATGEIPIAHTGDWKVFANNERDNVELTAGEQVMRFESISGDLDLNWIEIIPASAYSSAVVATDAMEPLKIGGRPQGAEWDFGADGGMVSIQQSPMENTKCLRLLDSNRAASVWALRKFPRQPVQAGFECRMRFGQMADGYALAILNGDKPAVLIFTQGNELGCEVGNGEWRALHRYDGTTWYNVRVSLDIKAKKFNVYIDGVQRGEGLPFRNGVDGVDGWQVETPVRNTGTLYLNSMKVTER